MKTITSSDFQKRYQKLDEPHEVTVFGRTVAFWVPVGTAQVLPYSTPESTEADFKNAQNLIATWRKAHEQE